MSLLPAPAYNTVVIVGMGIIIRLADGRRFLIQMGTARPSCLRGDWRSVKQCKLCLPQRLRLAVLWVVHPSGIEVAHQAAGAGVVHIPYGRQHRCRILALGEYVKTI